MENSKVREEEVEEVVNVMKWQDVVHVKAHIHGIAEKQNKGSEESSKEVLAPVMVENVADITEGLDHVLREVEERASLEVTGVAETPISLGQVNSEGEKEREWLDVSPGKAFRSPSRNKELKFGQLAILTNSRFAVLGSEEEGQIREDEDEAEGLKDDESSCVAGKETVVVPRQSLPRESKMKHKVLDDKSVQRAQDACLSDLNNLALYNVWILLEHQRV